MSLQVKISNDPSITQTKLQVEFEKRGEATTTVNGEELKAVAKNLTTVDDTRDLATMRTDAADLLHAELEWRKSQPYQAPRGTPVQVANLEEAESTYQSLIKVCVRHVFRMKASCSQRYSLLAGATLCT